MFDPIILTESTVEIVSRDGERKYYRFRSSRFYGGVSTADCVGCNLRCVFCWAQSVVTRPHECGRFYRPEDIAGNLMGIAGKKHLRQLRISGNEPTLARGHLIRVLELIGERRPFILETNGILIGADDEYAKQLSYFENLYVRVSLKGTCEEEFSRLTEAVQEGFSLQLKALENLLRYDVKAHPACMISFSPPENIMGLRKRLKAIHPSFRTSRQRSLSFIQGSRKGSKKGISDFSRPTLRRMSLRKRYRHRGRIKEAILYEKLRNHAVKCGVCRHRCIIAAGKRGYCKTRLNKDGILYPLIYNKVSSWSPDPIEKKPVFHFYPGSLCFSMGTLGCNFRCPGCQNWEISRAIAEDTGARTENITPEQPIRMAFEHN